MTKILILIFTVLLALNINASDTEPVEYTTTTTVNGIVSGQILVELTDHYGHNVKSSTINTKVTFKIIEPSLHQLGLIINYNHTTLELFYDIHQKSADFSLLRQGRELHVIDDTLKKQLNTIISSVRSNILRFLPSPYTRIETLGTIFKTLNVLTDNPVSRPIHGDVTKSAQDDTLPDARTPFDTFNLYDYQMICDSVGHQRQAAYTSFTGDWHFPTVWVGDHNSGCLGRSGAGCGNSYWIYLPWPWDNVWVQADSQYTQESLNHDVCADESPLGVADPACADELAEANWGYWYAPNCF